MASSRIWRVGSEGPGLYYIVSFDDCGIESPLQSRSPESALALAQEAERQGCRNVVVKLPSGAALSLRQFALQLGGGGPSPALA